MSLQIENLCDSRRIKLEGDLLDELVRLPQSLAGMYSLILENIGQIEQRGRSVAEAMFKWLLCTNDASSTVTIDACSRAISSEQHRLSISDILDVCSTLVIYDQVLDRFRFAHLSVREFLESQQGYSPCEANRAVLKISMQTMLGNRQSVRNWRSMGQFWFYAIRYWTEHYHRLEEQNRKDFFELHLKSFLFDGAESSDAFNMWASEAYALEPTLCFSGSFNSQIRNVADILQEYQAEGDIRKDLVSPVDVASSFGWLEILDHFEASQSPTDLQTSAMSLMGIAILSGQISVVRWLFDRSIYPTDRHLDLIPTGPLDGRPLDNIKEIVDIYVLSLEKRVHSQKLLAPTLRLKLREIYQDLLRKVNNVDYTLSSPAALDPSSCSSIEDLLLTATNPMVQKDDMRTPLSLLIWGEDQPAVFPSLLSTDEWRSTTGCYRLALPGSVKLYHYDTACVLVQYKLDSMVEVIDIRAEWMEILRLMATFTGLPSRASTSPTKRPEDLANDPGDRIQLVGQTLLSLASLFHHEKAFQALLDMGVDPTCPAICEARKKASIFTQMGHSLSRQEPLSQESGSIDQETMDELRQGPLAWAAYTGNLALVRSILDRGLKPNIKNRKGQTALYFAVQQTEEKYSRRDLETDKEAIVRLLLQKGAVVSSTGACSGATLLAHACKAGYGNVARLLRDHGVDIPNCGTDESTERVLGTFDQSQEEIRRNLLARVRTGDSLDIAAQLIWRGKTRMLGDVIQPDSKRVRR